MEETRQLTVDPYDCLPAQEPLELSYFHGTSLKPLCGKTIGQFLQDAARVKPDHVVFKLPEFNQSLTFNQLLSKGRSLAKGFLSIGLQRGDLVLCYRLCDEHFYIVFIACSLIGLIFTNPYIFTPYDVFLKELVLKSQPALIIAEIQDDPPVIKLLQQLSGDENENQNESLGFQRPNTLHKVVTVRKEEGNGFSTISDLIEAGRSIEEDRFEKACKIVSHEDCVYVLGTSGSSGASKLVCLSHYMLINYSIFCVARRAQGKREVMGYLSPIHDDVLCLFGTLEMICQWKVCSVGIIMPRSVDYSENAATPFLQFIQDFRISRPGCYPFQILSMINSPHYGNYDTSSLKGVTIVAQAISPENRRKILEFFPETVIAYGQCENIGIACTLPGVKGKEETNVVGYPLAHHEVKVVGQKGETLPVNTSGEIWVRGPCRFLGYLRDEEKTREVLDVNGWIHSGDIGKMDSEGYLTLIGRKSDCIRFKHLGEVVYPGHIEKAVKGLDKVKDVKVVGIQVDEEEGDSICLCVIKNPGVTLIEEELRDFCEEQLLSRDLPQYYFILDSFPVSGARKKVSSQKLKDQIKQRVLNQSGTA